MSAARLLVQGDLSCDGGGLRVSRRGEQPIVAALALPPDLIAVASACTFHIAENQPVVEGNKRAGVLSAVVFPELNGLIVHEPPSSFYDAMIAVADRRLDKEGLADLLRKWSRPLAWLLPICCPSCVAGCRSSGTWSDTVIAEWAEIRP